MEATIVAVWVTAGFSAIGTVYAIVRNGSRAKKQDEELKAALKNDLANIQKKLNDPDNGLAAIMKATEDQKDHCLEVSTNISTRVGTAEKEIERLRDKK